MYWQTFREDRGFIECLKHLYAQTDWHGKCELDLRTRSLLVTLKIHVWLEVMDMGGEGKNRRKCRETKINQSSWLDSNKHYYKYPRQSLFTLSNYPVLKLIFKNRKQEDKNSQNISAAILLKIFAKESHHVVCKAGAQCGNFENFPYLLSNIA